MPAKIKRGDTVVVLNGKDRGKRGTVRNILPKTGRIVVEGVNIAKRHRRARSQTEQSQIVEREQAIHISNVMLVDPSDNEPTRVTFRAREDGSLVRVGKRSGEDIE